MGQIHNQYKQPLCGQPHQGPAEGRGCRECNADVGWHTPLETVAKLSDSTCYRSKMHVDSFWDGGLVQSVIANRVMPNFALLPSSDEKRSHEPMLVPSGYWHNHHHSPLDMASQPAPAWSLRFCKLDLPLSTQLFMGNLKSRQLLTPRFAQIKTWRLASVDKRFSVTMQRPLRDIMLRLLGWRASATACTRLPPSPVSLQPTGHNRRTRAQQRCWQGRQGRQA